MIGRYRNVQSYRFNSLGAQLGLPVSTDPQAMTTTTPWPLGGSKAFIISNGSGIKNPLTIRLLDIHVHNLPDEIKCQSLI